METYRTYPSARSHRAFSPHNTDTHIHLPQLENGYAIWDFRGQELDKQIQDRFKQFIWRPRPPTLLTKDKQKQVRRNLKEFSRVFDEEDAAEESNVSAELVALRKRLVDEWNAWRAQRKKEVGEERAKRDSK